MGDGHGRFEEELFGLHDTVIIQVLDGREAGFGLKDSEEIATVNCEHIGDGGDGDFVKVVILDIIQGEQDVVVHALILVEAFALTVDEEADHIKKTAERIDIGIQDFALI